MAVTELGGIAEIEGWTGEKSRLSQITSGVLRFARRKPLGAVCGLIVLFFFIIGDIVPTTVNKFTDLAGLGDPVPYLMDVLADNTGFLDHYYDQKPRDRLRGSCLAHLLPPGPHAR